MSDGVGNGYSLSGIANLVKDRLKSAECTYFVALCEAMDVRVYDGSRPNVSPIRSREELLGELDPILLLYDAELRLLKGDQEGFVFDMKRISDLTEGTLHSSESDPLFFWNQVSVLEAIAGIDFKHLKRSLHLVSKIPPRIPEAKRARSSVALTLIDCIHLSSSNVDLIKEVPDLILGISDREMRVETLGLAARKLCMKDEITPAADAKTILFVRERLYPLIKDEFEKALTSIQLALSELLFSGTNNGTAKEMREHGMKILRDAERRSKGRINGRLKTVLDMNLVRVYAQIGMSGDSKSLRDHMLGEMKEALDLFEETLMALEESRLLSRSKFPPEIIEQEDQLINYVEFMVYSTCFGLALAARFSSDGELSKAYLRDVEDLIGGIPFPDLQARISLEIAASYSSIGMGSEANRNFAYGLKYLESLDKYEAVEFLMKEVNHYVSESYSRSADAELMSMYMKAVSNVKMDSGDWDECLTGFLGSIYFYKRSRMYGLTFNS